MSGHANLIPIRRLVGPRRWDRDVKLGYETWGRNSDRGHSVKLHRTEVCKYVRDFDGLGYQYIRLSTGGWRSGITLQRMNHGLEPLGLWVSRNDIKGEWRVLDGKGNAWTIRSDTLRLRSITPGSHKNDPEWERVQ